MTGAALSGHKAAFYAKCLLYGSLKTKKYHVVKTDLMPTIRQPKMATVMELAIDYVAS